MISAWDIYWVMQLDRIGGVVSFGAVILGCVAVMSLVCGAVFTECGTDKYMEVAERGWRTSKRISLWTGSLAGALVLASAFIPSTKTAAAMIVLPAIANNEAIQHEAADLYGIAKDALRELANPKQEAAK